MFLNIDDTLKKELQEEAEEKGLSLTAYIRMLLLERKKWNDKRTILARIK